MYLKLHFLIHARLSFFFFFFLFPQNPQFLKVISKKIKLCLSSSFSEFNLKKTIAFYFKYIGKPSFSGQKEKDKNKTEWWLVRRTFWVQRTDTSHTKQVRRALMASPGRFLSWLSFHYSSKAGGCANKKWIVGVWILNFEKREWRPYKEKKGRKVGGTK